MRSRPDAASVLVVCTANVCRSPYIQAVLAAAVPGLPVESAGTRALRGQHLDPRLAPLLAARGLAAGATTGRRLRRSTVARAGLILTATREHSAVVVEQDARAADRVFTLRELARLLRADPAVETVGGVAELAAIGRLRRAAADPSAAADDLPDPFGGSTTDYLAVFAAVDDALSVLAPLLRAAVPGRADAAD